MAYDQRSLDDYVDVAQRIAAFRTAYPDGCLRGDWQLIRVADQDLVAYRAEAWRSEADQAPGIGCAWELVPGRTPYTRGSELQNAETSAWGRAIIAVGASDSKKGIASREEVRNRRAEREDGLPQNKDGSLSRSQTTDAEKDAAGVMTSAQLAEHTALQPKASETRGRTQRLLSPDLAGPWIDQPAGQLPRPIEAEHAPGSIDGKQSRRMHALFRDLGITDRAVRLGMIQQVIGHEITTSSALSFTEAAAVLKALEQRVAGLASR